MSGGYTGVIMLGGVDDRRVGLAFRALRRRLGWRQNDLRACAGVTQQDVSDVERGHLEHLRLATIRRLAGALEAKASIEVHWRGGMLDRLVDGRHAMLVEAACALLIKNGWDVRPEVSFSLFGERGSIDIFAWHQPTRSVLLIEVKTELTSVEETLRRFDVKLRVRPKVALEIMGSPPANVGAALVLPDDSTARRRVAEHAVTFTARFPQPGRDVRRWLRHPVGPFSAVWFLSGVRLVRDKRNGPPPHRVRRPRNPPEPPGRG